MINNRLSSNRSWVRTNQNTRLIKLSLVSGFCPSMSNSNTKESHLKITMTVNCMFCLNDLVKLRFEEICYPYKLLVWSLASPSLLHVNHVNTCKLTVQIKESVFVRWISGSWGKVGLLHFGAWESNQIIFFLCN